ncbi:radical SAM protein [Candidatus Thorarchaeota archaeon]|nr:MAG: radical SAM protein [Candidatus Thorarchaeota archaeon]
MVDCVRVSLGTAIALGLEQGPNLSHFTTLFIMTHSETGCTANCAFCPQAIDSDTQPGMLSRIGWPKFDSHTFMDAANSNLDKFQRICIQCLNYPEVVHDCLDIISMLEGPKPPISVCIHPVSKQDMVRLHDAGVERIGIAMDACTPELFEKIKGNQRTPKYSWTAHMKALRNAVDIWGSQSVTTHLIVGLGETEKEASDFLFQAKDMGITVGLFAFTSIQGTALENLPQPDIGKYRRIQILRHLISLGEIEQKDISFTEERLNFDIPNGRLVELISNGSPFRVSGCPGCNRPYYNERPSGPLYNYPRPLDRKEVIGALKQAGLVNHN